MKIQCSCGAKHFLEIKHSIEAEPVLFVCPRCGVDCSPFVNQLIQQELPCAGPLTPGPMAASEPSLAPKLVARPHLHKPEPAVPAWEVGCETCSKHPMQPVMRHCLVCQKPICRQCMETFGYVCSVFCQGRAESTGIHVPLYAGRRAVIEAKRWRRLGMVGMGLGLGLVGLAVFWIWYAWYASVPKAVFSIRFEDRAYSGQTEFCGGQLVLLHGGTLARCDLKSKKNIWSRDLTDHAQVGRIVETRMKAIQQAIHQANAEASDAVPKMPASEDLTNGAIRQLSSALRFYVVASNLWVAHPGRLVRYDWDSGKPGSEMPLPNGGGHERLRGNELVVASQSVSGQAIVTHLDLIGGLARTEELGPPGRISQISNFGVAPVVSAAPSALDPAKVTAQAQQLPFAARIALPFTLAVNANQERALAEMRDSPQGRRPGPLASPSDPGAFGSILPAADGFVEFSARLLESRIVTRSAIKAAPEKSALNQLSGANSTDAANEILNEIQRNRGDDTVAEDESRYQVVVRRPGMPELPEWTGELTGPPELVALQTVDVIAAGKTVLVLNRKNQKIWQAGLAYRVSAGRAGEPFAIGDGPCAEYGGELYVFDQAVLTAFELATGKVRWRLPTVGVVGLFFDGAGALYVNTTTASPESIKYSRQIDITEKVQPVILKLEAATGKILWTAQPGGFISSLSGKFIYTVETYDPGDQTRQMDIGVETPPYFRLRRIDPGSGRVLWARIEERVPVAMAFDQNLIRLVFKREVEILRFFSL